MKKDFVQAVLLRLSDLIASHAKSTIPYTCYTDNEIIEHLEEVINILKNNNNET